jgi:hypothetical protein
LLLVLSLLIYGGAMLALPFYLFGLQIGLWLSGALLAGGTGVLIVLCAANRTQPPPTGAPCRIRVTPTPDRVWVRPRVIPFH